MKLSRIQKQVLERIRYYIESHKRYDTYEEMVLEQELEPHNRHCRAHGFKETTLEEYMVRVERMRQYYDDAVKHNIAIIRADTRTLLKLQELGYIEILKNGGSAPDRVRLLEEI